MNTPSLNLEGFASGDYEWEVRANCSSGDSGYVGCSFTYANRGANVNCGTVSPSAGYIPNGTLSEVVNLSPNPVSSFLLLEIENVQSDIYDISIFNTLGQMIHNTKVTKEQPWIEINVNTYQSGLYFASVYNGNSKTVTKFLVE